jgi:hypothetical protein
MNAIRALPASAVFALAVCALAGCGSGKLSEVSGTITYEGKAIEQGSISFILIPVDGNGPSGGSSIVDGKYSAKNVPVGMAKVQIRGARVTGQKQMLPDSPPVTTSEEMLPPKYHSASELTYDVKSGTQVKDFDLSK